MSAIVKPQPPVAPNPEIYKRVILEERSGTSELRVSFEYLEKIKNNPKFKHIKNIRIDIDSHDSHIDYDYYDSVEVRLSLQIVGDEIIKNPHYKRQNNLYLKKLYKYKTDLAEYKKTLKFKNKTIKERRV